MWTVMSIQRVQVTVEMMIQITPERMKMVMDLSSVVIVMIKMQLSILEMPLWITTEDCMIDADQDGFGQDLTITCCLGIEMIDSNNGDWEGASVRLEVGERSNI